MQLKMFTNSQAFASARSRRRVLHKQPAFRLVTILTPLHCEDGFFPGITKKTLALKDPALKASRWPESLTFSGAPFGAARLVFRRCGLWQADLPAGYPDPIAARVEILRIPKER